MTDGQSRPSPALQPVDAHLASRAQVPHKHLTARHSTANWKPLPAAKLHLREGEKVDPNKPQGEFDPNALWYDRVVSFPKERILVCGIEKNGVTELNELTAAIRNDTELEWFKYSPQASGIKFTTFIRLLKIKSWRKALIYRDPMERFLSAYNSKCLGKDVIDGYLHCQRFFNLTDEEVSLKAVAERLPRDGHLNPHWARQGAFCGNTFASNWNDYDYHIPTKNLSRLLDVFAGRLDNESRGRAEDYMRLSLPSRALSNHTTNAEAGIHNESLEVRQLLFDYYSEDYRLFQTNFVYTLSADDVERQARDWQIAVVAERLRFARYARERKERERKEREQKEWERAGRERAERERAERSKRLQRHEQQQQQQQQQQQEMLLQSRTRGTAVGNDS